MGLQRSRDSAIEQFVFALENASVAAVKRETSIQLDAAEDFPGGAGSLIPEVLDGISFGSSVEVIGACSPVSPFPGGGDGVGVGGLFGSSGDVMGAVSSAELLASTALRRFCMPLRLGTRKLYAIAAGAGGGCRRRLCIISAEFAIC